MVDISKQLNLGNLCRMRGCLATGLKNVRKTLFVRFYEGNITFIIVLFIYFCKIKVYKKSFES